MNWEFWIVGTRGNNNERTKSLVCGNIVVVTKLSAIAFMSFQKQSESIVAVFWDYGLLSAYMSFL